MPCKNGIHVCRPQDVAIWVDAEMYEVEIDGEIVEAKDKICVRRARLTKRIETWNKQTQRLFAADCAERALPIFETAYPNDTRPREAIEAARQFVRDEITAASRDAAFAAARVAGDAAWDAAWAAGAAAWGAEQMWQSARLLQYVNGEVS